MYTVRRGGVIGRCYRTGKSDVFLHMVRSTGVTGSVDHTHVERGGDREKGRVVGEGQL